MTEKVVALSRYFSQAPPRDAAWALFFLIGQRVPRAVTAPRLRQWATEVSGYPEWLIDASREASGDLSEALALLLPEPKTPTPAPPLHVLIEDRLLPLRGLPETECRELLIRTWGELGSAERLVWNQWVAGELRIDVPRKLIAQALAALAGVDPAEMAHHLMGEWHPAEEDFRRLMSGERALESPGRPYPFQLAHPMEGRPEDFGPSELWQAEMLYDGIRAQLIRRRGQVMLWSRGGDLLTDRFPEIASACRVLPEGVVLDGAIVAWREGAPLSSGALRQRLARKRLDAPCLAETPTIFMAFDLLESEGIELCGAPLRERRVALERLLGGIAENAPLQALPILDHATWAELAGMREMSRSHGAAGLMIKRLDSPYRAGRVPGAWWKWKCKSRTLHAVLMYAERGRHPDAVYECTFGVWSGDVLVPVAKIGCGLPEEENGELAAFLRANTLERFGPVRVVRQELVFELSFDAVDPAPRRKAGLILHLPRLINWRRDMVPGQADTLENLRSYQNIP